ncbi:MAG TPA: alpha/beta hydrolase family protein [Flavisolibacter sp.]|nr:alpha/beta hydrolase family protein [Flavisolibacter sp.]
MNKIIFFVFFFTCLTQASGQAVKTAASQDKAAAIWKELAPFFSPPEVYKDSFGTYRSPLLFNDGRLVKTAADWRERRKEMLAQWHNMMGEWPPLLENQKLQVIDTVKRDGFAQHRVRFKWMPNEVTEGYLLIPDGKGKRPAVITAFYEPETAIGLGTSERTKNKADFAYQLVKRGFVTLSIGTPEATKAATFSLYYPSIENAQVAPLSMLGYAAANAWYVLSKVPVVDAGKIGIMGFSFGGKWAMFASCLFEKFACAVWSDAGIVFDEGREAVNYWEPWYLGYHPKPWRKRGLITQDNPAFGLYPELVKKGHDLHELHALMAPRPFLVSGGSEDPTSRWIALNHSIAVNRVLGYTDRVAMTNDRAEHLPTPISNEQAYLFFEYFLKYNGSAKQSISRRKR